MSNSGRESNCEVCLFLHEREHLNLRSHSNLSPFLSLVSLTWPFLARLHSWVSEALLQRHCSTKTLMPCWIKQKRQTAISVAGTLCCSKEGIDFIFMILNYKCLAIWGARVNTTDDASGKCLVAVGGSEKLFLSK